MRSKQPDTLELSFTNRSYQDVWRALIETWTYSGIKNEDVFARNLIIKFEARNAREALDFAQAIAATLAHVHDVHQTNVRWVGEDKHCPKVTPDA